MCLRAATVRERLQTAGNADSFEAAALRGAARLQWPSERRARPAWRCVRCGGAGVQCSACAGHSAPLRTAPAEAPARGRRPVWWGRHSALLRTTPAEPPARGRRPARGILLRVICTLLLRAGGNRAFQQTPGVVRFRAATLRERFQTADGTGSLAGRLSGGPFPSKETKASRSACEPRSGQRRLPRPDWQSSSPRDRSSSACLARLSSILNSAPKLPACRRFVAYA
jgi:hypothetical protein